MDDKISNSPSDCTCEFLSICDFFEVFMFSVPQLSEKMRQNYCYGICGNCARHEYSKVYGVKNMPDDLFPNSFIC